MIPPFNISCVPYPHMTLPSLVLVSSLSSLYLRCLSVYRTTHQPACVTSSLPRVLTQLDTYIQDHMNILFLSILPSSMSLFPGSEWVRYHCLPSMSDSFFLFYSHRADIPFSSFVPFIVLHTSYLAVSK